MTGQMSRQGARRRVVQLGTFEDGLWDILLGKVFILLGIYPLTRNLLGPTLNLALFLGILALLVVAVSAARRIFSVPRLGLARLKSSPLTRVMRIALLVATLVLVLATLFMAGTAAQPALAGLIIVLTGAGLFLRFVRRYPVATQEPK